MTEVKLTISVPNRRDEVRFLGDGQYHIGGDRGEICLNIPQKMGVSRCQAMIVVLRDGRVFVYDGNCLKPSSNGTWINGKLYYCSRKNEEGRNGVKISSSAEIKIQMVGGAFIVLHLEKLSSQLQNVDPWTTGGV